MPESRSSTLAYAVPSSSPRKLTLDETDGTATLTFPVPPMWVRYTPLACMISFMLLIFLWMIYGGGNLWAVVREMPRDAFGSVSGFMASVAMIGDIAFFVFHVFALFSAWHWGDTPPRKLILDKETFTDAGCGLWSISERCWPLCEMKEVHFKHLKGVVPRFDAAELSIEFDNGSIAPIRFRRRDIQTAERFANLLEAALVSKGMLPLSQC